MDIRSFFGSSGASSSQAQPTAVQSEEEYESSDSDAESQTECLEPSPAKKKKSVDVKHRSKSRQATSIRKYNRKWEERFNWLIFDDNFQGAFCKVCRKRGVSPQRTGGMDIEALQKLE